MIFLLNKNIHKDAIIPQCAHKGDAGMDLYTGESLLTSLDFPICWGVIKFDI